MTDITTLQRVLQDSELLETIPSLPRSREPHCVVRPANLPALTALICDRLGAQLIFVGADDRRATRAAFHIHYLFAHPRDRWFVVASTFVTDSEPFMPSIAVARYSASRFERE